MEDTVCTALIRLDGFGRLSFFSFQGFFSLLFATQNEPQTRTLEQAAVVMSSEESDYHNFVRPNERVVVSRRCCPQFAKVCYSVAALQF